jgi:DNA-binding NtrC family response regulator
MQHLREIDPKVPVIIVTAYADIPMAVNAIKQGAYDFLTKPLNFGHLVLTINHAVERLMLERRYAELDTTFNSALEAALGPSEATRKLIDQVRRIAASDFVLLIQGETGSGKTYLANLIHSISRRSAKPFVKVSIGSLQESVVESELFGYEKGAFTGAEKTKKGFFEIADGGTLFIDDLDNISSAVQGKLLSIVEDRKVFRVGSPVPSDIDIRIICATNADILKLVAEKKFREDLFFRLSEITLRIPPLRERRDDIDFFAKKFLIEACTELNSSVCSLSDDAKDMLLRYPWPGNIRQIKNVMKQAAVHAGDDIIRAADIEGLLISDPERAESPDSAGNSGFTIKNAEKAAIEKALEHTGGQKLKAASLLQIDYKTLVRKMKEYSID